MNESISVKASDSEISFSAPSAQASASVSEIKLNIYLDALIQKFVLLDNENTQLSGWSIRYLGLVKKPMAQASDAVLAEISLRSPRKLFIFIIKIYVYRIKISRTKYI